MKLNRTEVEKYAKDYIESKAYLDTLRESRKKLNFEFEEQSKKHEQIEDEILAKFENPNAVAVIVGKKIFTIQSYYKRQKSESNPIQIWDTANS